MSQDRTQISKKNVDIIVENEQFQPDAPPLSKEETKIAAEDLIRRYKKVYRYRNDPKIEGQEISGLSFMLLKEPIDGIHGFVKVRGTWPGPETATKKCEEIIENVDSIYPVHLANVGYWHPITNDPKYTQEKIEVKTEEQLKATQDRAAKHEQVKKEQYERHVSERKEQLKIASQAGDDDDKNSLNYYTKKRVAIRELTGYIDNGKEKLARLKKKLRKLKDEVVTLNKANPKYMDQWLANYNDARTKAGLPQVTEQEIANIPFMGTADVEDF